MKKKVRKAIIPAAGLGTRMLPATKAQPKEMLPIVDKPAMQYLIEEIIEAGIEEILIITGRNKMSIENHFDYSYELEMILKEAQKEELLKKVEHVSTLANIHYVRQKKALGLGHAVNCAKSFVGDEPFLILLGDDIIYTEAEKDNVSKQMLNIYNSLKGNVNILGVKEVLKEDLDKYGVIEYSKSKKGLLEVNSIIEKPNIEEAPSNYAVLGRYILQPEIFSILEDAKPTKGGEIQLTDAILEMINEGIKTYGYIFDGKRYDTGNKYGMLVANIEYGLRDNEIGDKIKEYLKKLSEKL